MKVNAAELQQIIKEEALRLKKKMMLEAEKTTIMKRLQEIDECMMDETAPMEETINEAATEQEAAAWLGTMLKNKTTLAQIQQVINSVMKLGANAPQWAQAAFAGKNLQDKAQYNQAYQEVYKLWADAYKKYYMANPKMPYTWDINTNTFTPRKSAGTGLGFGFGTQHESVDKTK